MKRNSVFNRATNNFHFLTHTIGGFTMNKGTQILRSVVLLSFLSLGLMSINTHAALSPFGQQFWQQGADGIKGTAENVDEFGYSVATGDFNGDGYDGLAIGVPKEDGDRGVVHVIYGSSSGLDSSGNQKWHQDSNGIKGTAEASDRFGYSLAAGDFNGDEIDDLAIGVPGEKLDTYEYSAGRVNVIYGSSGSGLTGTGDQIWRQGEDGIKGTAEGDDQFGYSLAAGDFNGDEIDDLAIGVPTEDVYSVANASLVNVIYGSSSGLDSSGNQKWHQDSNSIKGTAEAGDQFGYSLAAGDFDGDGVADLAIGVPFENLNTGDDVGRVNVIYGSSGSGLTGTGDQIWAQGEDGIKGTPETFDQFGYSLAAGDFDGDEIADLTIGVPFDEVDWSVVNHGQVNVIYGTPSGLDSNWNRAFHTHVGNLGGLLIGGAEDNERLGYSVAVGDFNGDGVSDLTVGAPSSNSGVAGTDPDFAFEAGAVHVIYGNVGTAAAPAIPTVVNAQPVVSNGPAENKLMQNMPNPFNPETWIPYQLKDGADVTIEIYNPTGTLVRELNLGHQVSGYYANRSKAVYWDGRNEFGEHVASGVYFYRISAGDYSATKKMVILK